MKKIELELIVKAPLTQRIKKPLMRYGKCERGDLV